MKKFYFFLLILIFFPIRLYAVNLDLNSKQAIIYNPKSDYILYEKNSDKISQLASLTKIMTTIVAIENIDNIKEKVIITKDMLKNIPIDASVAGLKVGDTITYEDLLYASILPSGADATTALAISISGSTSKFIKLMNDKAKDLLMYNTNFCNVTGYDIDNHYSTPNDILKLLNYSLKNKLFKEIYMTRSYKLTNGLYVNSTINKYNKNLKLDTSNILGSKTGYTQKAGLCMSAIINCNGEELILITLGAERKNGVPNNLTDTLNIIKYYSENYENKTIYESGKTLFSIPVINCKTDKYNVKLKNNITRYLKKDDDLSKISYKYNGIKELSSKNKIKEKIGKVEYYYDNILIYEEDIILDKKLEFSFFKYICSNIYIILIFIVFILISVGICIYFKNRKDIKRFN